MSRLLFTYGILTNRSVMAERCPAAQLLGRARLPGFRLTFRWVANAERCEGSTVLGVLWRLNPSDEIVLDRYEGYPTHYTKLAVDILLETLEQVEAQIYVLAEQQAQECPRAKYRDAIVEGYLMHGLSTKQINIALRGAESEYDREIEAIRKEELDYRHR